MVNLASSSKVDENCIGNDKPRAFRPVASVCQFVMNAFASQIIDDAFDAIGHHFPSYFTHHPVAQLSDDAADNFINHFLRHVSSLVIHCFGFG